MTKLDETIKRRDEVRDRLLKERAALLDAMTQLGEFDQTRAAEKHSLEQSIAERRRLIELDATTSVRAFNDATELRRRALQQTVIDQTRALERDCKQMVVLTSEVVSLAHADLAGVIGSAKQVLGIEKEEPEQAAEAAPVAPA